MALATLPPEVQRAAAKAALSAAKRELRRGMYVRNPQRMLQSLGVSYYQDKIVITTDHPAFEYLDKGVRQHVMTYLKKAGKPIPILTSSGEVVYRKASSKSLSQGGWVHPGIQGKNFTEKMQVEATKAASEVIAQHYSKEYLKTVQSRLQKIIKKRRY